MPPPPPCPTFTAPHADPPGHGDIVCACLSAAATSPYVAGRGCAVPASWLLFIGGLVHDHSVAVAARLLAAAVPPASAAVALVAVATIAAAVVAANAVFSTPTVKLPTHAHALLSAALSLHAHSPSAITVPPAGATGLLPRSPLRPWLPRPSPMRCRPRRRHWPPQRCLPVQLLPRLSAASVAAAAPGAACAAAEAVLSVNAVMLLAHSHALSSASLSLYARLLLAAAAPPASATAAYVAMLLTHARTLLAIKYILGAGANIAVQAIHNNQQI